MRPVLRRCVFFVLPALALALSACVYRVDIQQGNALTGEMVAQVETGMSKREVTRILGLPLVTDPFHRDRWDYFHSLRDGKSGETTRQFASLQFEDDRLVSIYSSFDTE